MVSLTSLIFNGPSIGGAGLFEFFNQYQEFIVYTIPFLLIFAIIFGILTKAKIFGENKAVATIIAISIAFLALWEGSVIDFFAILFPNLGIAIAVLLSILILLGLFMSFEKTNVGTIILFVVGALLAVIVVLSSLTDYTWWGSSWWQQYGGLIVLLIIIGVVVGVIIGTSGPKKPSKLKFLVPGEE